MTIHNLYNTEHAVGKVFRLNNAIDGLMSCRVKYPNESDKSFGLKVFIIDEAIKLIRLELGKALDDMNKNWVAYRKEITG